MMLPDADGRVAATVRVFRFAFCARAADDTREATDTVHCSYAARVASATLSVSVAATVADPVTPVVNVVVPHPLNVGVARLAIVKVGSTSAMESGVGEFGTNGTFSAKVNEMAVGASVDGVPMVSTLCSKAGVGTVTAVDKVICAAVASFA